MRKCSVCGRARFWALADGRHKCKSCGHRQRDVLSAWESLWLSDAQKHQLIERFVLGVPVYRQRFRPVCGANTAEKVYRLLRACCAYAEQWRELVQN
jgi:transposase